MKSKAHIYMANLIMDEVKTNGQVKIGETEYAVPTKVLEVIKKYPEYVRAGSVGPDFFPDLIIGQMDIHPKDSGKFIKLMWDELTTMKEGSDYDQAFAFYLGFTLHYACDMFSHYYINEYAGGFFPDITSALNVNFPCITINAHYLSIILRHITIESYLDNKVKKQDLSIKIPSNYLMRCFGTLESWDNIANIVPKNKYEFLRTMVDEYSKALKSSDNIDSRHSQEYQKRLITWMNEWQKFAEDSVLGREHNFDKILDIIRRLPINDGLIKIAQLLIFIYQIERSPAPIIMDILTGSYLNPLKWVEKGFELAFYQSLLTALYESDGVKKDPPKTTKNCKDELHKLIRDYVTDPARLLDNSALFASLRQQKKCQKLTEYFNKEWGNFGTATDCQSQTFDVFRRCLNMGKLCLVGNNNLIKIAEKYNAGDYSNIFKDGVLKHKVSKISVYIKVANEVGAGANSDVHLTIYQKDSSRKRYQLDSKENDFRIGSEKTYTINFDKKVGINDFDLFELGCDFTSHKAELVIEKMIVKDVDSGDTILDVNRYVIIRGRPLKIKVNGDPTISKLNVFISTPDEAGGWTNADVEFLTITNKTQKFGPMTLPIMYSNLLDKPGKDDFRRGSSETYEVYLKDPVKIEDLKQFALTVKYNKFTISKMIVKDGLKNITLAEVGRNVIKSDDGLYISLNPNELLKKYK